MAINHNMSYLMGMRIIETPHLLTTKYRPMPKCAWWFLWVFSLPILPVRILKAALYIGFKRIWLSIRRSKYSVPFNGVVKCDSGWMMHPSIAAKIQNHMDFDWR